MKKTPTQFSFRFVIISRQEKLFVYLRRSLCKIVLVTVLTFEGSFEISNVTHTLTELKRFSGACLRSTLRWAKDAIVGNLAGAMSSILINT
jgi:hypothetical protein